MIPEASANATGEMRSIKRSNLLLAATINVGGLTQPVLIRDLSFSGARLEGRHLPDVGAEASIRRGRLCAVGKVVWRHQERCGVRFETTLQLDEWLLSGANRGQSQVDRLVVQLRSDGPAVDRRTSSIPDGPNLPCLLAEELACVARMLDQLGDRLVSEPSFVIRYAADLQGLDIAKQILGHLASVLTADEPNVAIDAIGMESLRRRLQRRPITPFLGPAGD